jgi:2',3'-cyclic-nucleotide 2'-phosphodiesterase (5'-nucleotidase family)
MSIAGLDGFWIDRYAVTNEAFARFIAATGYTTLAERAPDPADFPGAPAENLVPGSMDVSADATLAGPGGAVLSRNASDPLTSGRTPVVQTGLERKNLGELVVTVDGGTLKVESYRLHPIDDSIAGDRAMAGAIDQLKKSVTTAVSPVRPAASEPQRSGQSRWADRFRTE